MKDNNITTHNQEQHTDTEHPAALSPDERAQLRAEFMAFLDMHPVPERRSARHAIFCIPWIWRSVASAAVFVVIGVAAFHSVPLTTPEHDRTGVPVSLQSQRANAALLARKLHDAERLVASDQFEPRTFNTLKTDIDAQTSTLHTHMLQARAAGNIEDVREVSTELETLLATHYAILYVLADTYDRLDDDSVAELIDEIDQRRAQVSEIRAALVEQQTEIDNTPTLLDYATGLSRDVHEANDRLARVVDSLLQARNLSEREEALLRQADLLVAESAQLLDAAQHPMHERDIDEAIQLLRAASAKTQKALLFIEAHTVLYPDAEAIDSDATPQDA